MVLNNASHSSQTWQSDWTSDVDSEESSGVAGSGNLSTSLRRWRSTSDLSIRASALLDHHSTTTKHSPFTLIRSSDTSAKSSSSSFTSSTLNPKAQSQYSHPPAMRRISRFVEHLEDEHVDDDALAQELLMSLTPLPSAHPSPSPAPSALARARTAIHLPTHLNLISIKPLPRRAATTLSEIHEHSDPPPPSPQSSSFPLPPRRRPYKLRVNDSQSMRTLDNRRPKSFVFRLFAHAE